MQTPDPDTQPLSLSSSPTAEATQVLLTVTKDDCVNAAPVASSEMPYLVRLLAITSTVGIGAVLLGQGIWQPETNAARLPAPEMLGMDRPQQAPLRDRMLVTTLRMPAVSAPESLPTFPINARLQPGQPAGLPTVRVSHGFENAGQPALEAALPVPTEPQAQTTAIPSAPQAAPALTAPSVSPQAAPAPVVIASLLQTPPARTPEAIVLRPASAREATGDRTPAQTALNPASNNAEPTALTSTPVEPHAVTVEMAASTPPIATAPTAPTAPTRTAIDLAATTPLEQTRPPQQEIELESLLITGNTRFSARELTAVVQQAIASTAESLPSHRDAVDRKLSPAELLEASAAIAKFYAAHGYLNAGAYVPAAVFNGAKPEIRIVEGTQDASKEFGVR